MFYTKLDPLMFQIEQSSNCCLGDRVWVNESPHPLHFLLRCFKSVLWQNVPHQAWCTLEFLSVWPWADLWRLHTTDLHHPTGTKKMFFLCNCLFCSNSKFKQSTFLMAKHDSWWKTQVMGRTSGGDRTPSFSVGYSTENEDGLHLNDPHCLNVNVTPGSKVISCGGCLNSSSLHCWVYEHTRITVRRTILNTFFPYLVHS